MTYKNEPIIYNITVNAGRDYSIEFLTDEFDFSGWTAEATMREFAEHPRGTDFRCITDAEGIHLQLAPGQTRHIGWHQGEWDLFIITPDNNLRIPLARGRACIKPESAR